MYLIVPRPISLNNMFADFRGRRIITREYRQWRQECDASIKSQSPEPIAGPVEITVELPDKFAARMDTDNTAKAYLDALVRTGVIADDRGRTVRRLVLEWVDRDHASIAVTARSYWLSEG